MLKLLMFLIDHWASDERIVDADRGVVMDKLEDAGFLRREIEHVLNWLAKIDDMAASLKSSSMALSSFRVYTVEERFHLGRAGVQFLTFLENMLILDPFTREIVIDRVFALGERDIELHDIKWVALVVMFHLGDRPEQLHMLEDLVLVEAEEVELDPETKDTIEEASDTQDAVPGKKGK